MCNYQYQAGDNGMPMQNGKPCPGMLEAYGPIPDAERFERGYLDEVPKEIQGWQWSETFRRWGALVTFKDGKQLFTWPLSKGQIYFRKRDLVEKVGYRIEDNGTGFGWYALLPGEDGFFDDGEGGQNYLGFFSSLNDLLDEVEETVVSKVMTRNGMTDEAWENLYHHERVLIASRLFQQ